MPDDFSKVRELLRQFAEMMENMWIEREAMRNVLMGFFGASPETIDESLKIAKEQPEMREMARKAFAGMHKALEQESLDILAQEMLEKLPNTGKPN